MGIRYKEMIQFSSVQRKYFIITNNVRRSTWPLNVLQVDSGGQHSSKVGKCCCRKPSYSGTTQLLVSSFPHYESYQPDVLEFTVKTPQPATTKKDSARL